MVSIPLTKYIARAGYASRRKAEELIRAGKVEVNGAMAVLGMKVGDSDTVRVEGKTLNAPVAAVYIALHKPKGYVCTTRRHNSEQNVFELLVPERAAAGTEASFLATIHQRSLHIVGRLDKDSRGLLLLTNDGDFTLQATHPRYQHEKEYEVAIGGLGAGESPAVDEITHHFKHGIDIGEGDGVAYAKKCEYVGRGIFRIIITEGKKRQIRRMFKAIGYSVRELVRIRIGDIELGTLPEGKWQQLPPAVAGRLKDGITHR